MEKEFILLFMLFMMLFILRVIFLCGNFATCFFQSNDKWKYTFNTNIFISNFTFFTFGHKLFFFLLQQYITYPFTDSRNNLCSFILITVTLLTSICDNSF